MKNSLLNRSINFTVNNLVFVILGVLVSLGLLVFAVDTLQVQTSEALTCPAGQTDCGGVCKNLQTDANYCGSCNSNCSLLGSQNLVCIQGQCKCPNGEECGCNKQSCSQSDQYCTGFGCVCSSGEETYCSNDGSCANLDDDSLNCGACGIACSLGETCINGMCS